MIAGKDTPPLPANRLALLRLLHNVDRNLADQHFNNLVFGGIHSIRNLVWDHGDDAGLQHQGFAAMLKVLNLVSPHIAEELWQRLGFAGLLIDAPWWEPIVAADLVGDTEKYVVQVNGKRRDELDAPAGTADAALFDLARALPNVARSLEGATERQAKVVRRQGGHGIIFFVAK